MTTGHVPVYIETQIAGERLQTFYAWRQKVQRKMAQWLGIVWLIIAAVACARFSRPPTTPPPTVSPDQHILFHNAIILTMNDQAPRAEALAIRGAVIEAVGSNTEILALRRPQTTVIDLHGRTLMPGFIDAHTHLFNDAEQYFEMTLSEVQQVALENGITSIGDLYVDDRFLRQIQEFDQQGQLRIRTSLYLVATDNCGKPLGDWYKNHRPSHTAGEMLHITGVKIFSDGGTCQRPALSYELRPGEGLEDLFFSQEELNGLVGEAQAAGYQVAIHAIGDRAVEQAQNAIAAALNGRPNAYRHRIEHNSVIRPELLPRYGEIGIIPIVFGLYPVCEPFGPPPPADYRAWEWPYRALLDANPSLPVAWHGDDPFFGRIRPLDDLASLVTRDEPNEDGSICPAPAWLKAHAITTAEALPMMTINAAFALFRDDEIGSLVPGKMADVIVLSADPTSVPNDEISAIEVWMTMVGGRVEYCAPGHEPYCP